MSSAMARLTKTLGLTTLVGASSDAKYLCAQRFVRMFAFGSSTLILVQYLSFVTTSDSQIGFFMTLTLLGDVFLSFWITALADSVGRKRVLALGASLMALSGVVFAVFDNYWIFLLASVVGVISPGGNEVGPFQAIEQSTLAQLTPKDLHADIFAWYQLLGQLGAALGILTCGWLLASLDARNGYRSSDSYRLVFWIYALLGLVKLALTVPLTAACETNHHTANQHANDSVDYSDLELRESLVHDTDNTSTPAKPHAPPPPRKSLFPHISATSRGIAVQICSLMALDSFASGLVTVSWVVYFYAHTFSLSSAYLGQIFFATNLVGALSALVAAAISRSIGPLKTMVFTHMPSAIFLALIPVPTHPALSVMFLILRHCTASMDQAPRQAFIAAAVLPQERTAVMGLVNVVKTLAQALGAGTTGRIVDAGNFWLVFVLAGTMKISYDIGILWSFLGFTGREDSVS